MGEEDQDDPHLLCVQVECLKLMEIEASCRGSVGWSGGHRHCSIPIRCLISGLAEARLVLAWKAPPTQGDSYQLCSPKTLKVLGRGSPTPPQFLVPVSIYLHCGGLPDFPPSPPALSAAHGKSSLLGAELGER